MTMVWGLEQGRQARHVLHHRLGIGGQEEQVQLPQALVGERALDGLGDLGKLGDGGVPVPPQDGDGGVPAEGLGQGPADEA